MLAALVLDTIPAGVGRRIDVAGRSAVEVDLDALADAVGHRPVVRLARYAVAQQQFRRAERHTITGAPTITVRRTLVDVRQRDPGGGARRETLGAHIEALRLCPTLAPLAKLALSNGCDEDELDEMAESMGGTVERDGNDCFVEVTVDVAGTWPLELGGGCGLDERRRTIRLRVNRAKWRTSPTHKLMALTVTSVERYTDPVILN